MTRTQLNLYTSLQMFFVSRAYARGDPRAGTTATESGVEEVAATPEELPLELRDALSRTLALVAGTTNARDTSRILHDHYAKFAVYETNLLWCPHRFSIAAWLGAARMLLQPYIEGIRCHRVVLRRAPAASLLPLPSTSPQRPEQPRPAHEASATGRGASSTPTDQLIQMQMDVAFVWRPLAPLYGVLSSWGMSGLQMPAFTTEHTITLTIDQHSRIVAHRDITHNFVSAPPFLKGLLGLPTPLVATLLHV
ncbi:hypothetical protein GPECTOR_14g170 [Gonium pectorale]|uniref:Uncharacterized protein n=1 Tax=Gonium pectorale TaxID=33097 RepID=A0A150GMA0_GONPE|nr:hypothetical protein GPECTOR_14g170 [Gonium pectorale]|eukprot:KXZ50924.1 hypothetical protein GPECTOR_14g170 [Gonium pectorale]